MARKLFRMQTYVPRIAAKHRLKPGSHKLARKPGISRRSRPTKAKG